MAPGIGEAFPEIDALRASAKAGGNWFEVDWRDDGVVVTVMVNTAGQPDEDLTAFEVAFDTSNDGYANVFVDISGREGISPGSSSPSDGWVGWVGDDLVLAWRQPELEMVGAVVWAGRSPFVGLEDEEGAAVDEAWARLAAAIVCQQFELESEALRYLPLREQEA